MKKICLLILCLLLNGCFGYPSKRVANRLPVETKSSVFGVHDRVAFSFEEGLSDQEEKDSFLKCLYTVYVYLNGDTEPSFNEVAKMDSYEAVETKLDLDLKHDVFSVIHANNYQRMLEGNIFMLETDDGNKKEWTLVNACNRTSLGYQYELLDFTDGVKKLTEDIKIRDCYVIDVDSHHKPLFQSVQSDEAIMEFEDPGNNAKLLEDLVAHKDDKTLLTELNERYLYEQIYLNKDYCILNVLGEDGKSNWLMIQGGEVRGTFSSYDDILYRFTDVNGTESQKHLSELSILKAYKFEKKSPELTNKP